MALFTGAGVALITPFNEDKSVNYDMLGELIEYQISNSTDAIIICGTTGEPATMTEDEKQKLYSFDYSSISALRDIKRVFNNRLMDYFAEKDVL